MVDYGIFLQQIIIVAIIVDDWIKAGIIAFSIVYSLYILLSFIFHCKGSTDTVYYSDSNINNEVNIYHRNNIFSYGSQSSSSWNLELIIIYFHFNKEEK